MQGFPTKRKETKNATGVGAGQSGTSGDTRRHRIKLVTDDTAWELLGCPE